MSSWYLICYGWYFERCNNSFKLQNKGYLVSVWRSTAFLFAQTDPYWTVETLTARDRSRIGNQTVCGLVEMLRLAARANCSALLNIRRPPPDHPRYRSWFMDTLWAVQKAGISHKRVRTVGAFVMIFFLFKHDDSSHTWIISVKSHVHVFGLLA